MSLGRSPSKKQDPVTPDGNTLSPQMIIHIPEAPLEWGPQKRNSPDFYEVTPINPRASRTPKRVSHSSSPTPRKRQCGKVRETWQQGSQTPPHADWNLYHSSYHLVHSELYDSALQQIKPSAGTKQVPPTALRSEHSLY